MQKSWPNGLDEINTLQLKEVVVDKMSTTKILSVRRKKLPEKTI